MTILKEPLIHSFIAWRCRRQLRTALLVFAATLFSLDAATQPEARFERLGPFGGTVRSLLISARSSRIVYLGTSDGQLYKSADGGVSWKLQHPGLNRRQIVIDSLVEDPADPDHLFAGAWALRSDGGGLFESKDAGRSWIQVRLPHIDVAVRGFAISKKSPTHMIAGTLAGVFLTSDGGRTWQQTGSGLEAFRQVESVAIDPEDPRFLYVGTWHLGYRSSDFGKTWALSDRGMISDSDVFSITVDDRNGKNLFASACTGLYRSVDRGVSWTRLRVFPKSFQVRAQVVFLDPSDSTRVYGGTTEGLFVSRNSGQNWERITDPDIIVHSIQIDPADADVILLGTESHGVLRTRDRGRNWTAANAGFVHRSIARIVPDLSAAGRFFVGAQADGKEEGFCVFDASTGEWVQGGDKDVTGEDMLALVTLPGNRRQVAGTGRGAFLRDLDTGLWSRLPGPISSLNIFDLALDVAGGWIFAGTNDGVYRARLPELNFQKPTGYSLIPRVFTLYVPRSSAARVFAGTHMGVLRSDDAGATWISASQGIPDHTVIQCLASSPAGEAHILAGTTSGLYESRDGGNSWGPVADGRLGVDISSVLFLDSSGKRVIAADHAAGGVFFSEDGGLRWDKWENSEFGSPIRCCSQDPWHPSIIYLGTRTEGVYRLSLPR